MSFLSRLETKNARHETGDLLMQMASVAFTYCVPCKLGPVC